MVAFAVATLEDMVTAVDSSLGDASMHLTVTVIVDGNAWTVKSLTIAAKELVLASSQFRVGLSETKVHLTQVVAHYDIAALFTTTWAALKDVSARLFVFHFRVS